MITIRINQDVVDKSREYKGKKGTYLDAVLLETPGDKFGNDFMIVQSISKEERENGIKGNILGNGKNFNVKEAADKKESKTEAKGYESDDLPF